VYAQLFEPLFEDPNNVAWRQRSERDSLIQIALIFKAIKVRNIVIAFKTDRIITYTESADSPEYETERKQCRVRLLN
jgi:hypothetical protein